MKTDPFDDAIRRKLDGVNPPFQEKNWTQFQRFMGSQGFPPSLWQSPVRWLQPALTAAAVAGMVVTSIWQYRSNQALTAQMQTLTKTVQRLEQVQTQLQQTATATRQPHRVDTVYLTQRVGSGTLSSEQLSTLQGEQLSTLADPGASGTYPRRPDQATRLPVAIPQSNQSTANPDIHRDVPIDELTAVSVQPSERVGRQSKTRQYPPNQSISQSSSAKPDGSILYSTSVRNSSLAGRNNSASSTNAGSTNVPGEPTAGQPTGPDALANLQLLTPIPLPDQSEALAENWKRQLRRARFQPTNTQSAVAANTAVPAKNTTPVAAEWRLGIGGDVGTVQSGFGGYGEVILANRWKIGVGISEISWSGDVYLTEQQFKVKTKHEFRRYYPASGPPTPLVLTRPREVEDISRSGQSVVVPIQFGYRIGPTNRYVVTPTVGINFSINPYESVTYTLDRQRVRNDYWQNISIDRPVNRYSNWTLGVGLERQWKHIVGQLAPTLTIPLSGLDAGLNKPSFGIGGRLFYRL